MHKLVVQMFKNKYRDFVSGIRSTMADTHKIFRFWIDYRGSIIHDSPLPIFELQVLDTDSR